MADRKITELANITGADLADGDEFVVVDASADETKSITFGELKSGLDTATGFVRITGDTMTGALDVQSTITADGLTVDGGGSFTQAGGGLKVLNNGTAGYNANIFFGVSNQTDGWSLGQGITANDGVFRLYDNGAGNVKMSVTTGGDISFYEDQGITPKFVWKAADERLGLGTDSPDTNLHLEASTPVFRLTNPQTTSSLGLSMGKIEWETRDASAAGVIGYIDVVDSNNFGTTFDMAFATGQSGSATERMRIDSNGNVGIGVVPSAWSSTGVAIQLEGTGHLATANQYAYIGSNYYYNAGWKYTTSSTAAQYRQDSGSHQWLTAASGTADAALTWSEAMRIDSSGNVGIGTSSPNEKLVSSGTVRALGTTISNEPSTTLSYSSGVGGIEVRGPDISTRGSLNLYQAASNGSLGQTALHIDSSGNVGIKNSVMSSFEQVGGANLLVLGSGAGSQGMTIYSGNTGVGSIAFADGTTTTQEYEGLIQYSHSTNSLALYSNHAERMRIDSSGNVGIGGTPAAWSGVARVLEFDGQATDYIGLNSGASGYIYQNAYYNGTNNIYKNTGLASAYGQASGVHSWFIAPSGTAGTTATLSERMRIDSSGNLLVGKTVTTQNTAGTQISASSGVRTTVDGNVATILNRTTSDGDIALFRKDGATVGSIGTASDYLYIYSPKATGGAGIGLGNSWIYPCNSTGSISDATFDLGISNARYKNLYLSGGVYLGGTGAANKLDDYEEGASFTITDQSGAALSLTVLASGYTKIGQMVHAWYSVTYPITSDTSPARLSLPFTSALASSFTGGAVLETSYTGGAIMASVDATTYVRFRNNGLTPLLNSDLSAKNVRFIIHYIAA